MSRRAIIMLVALALLTSLGSPAFSQQEPPPHPHMLVLGLELDSDEEPVAIRKCVDLAAGRSLPLNAHHEHLHVGRAGEAQFLKAGNAAVPGAPIAPWANCDELIAFFFGE